MQNNLESVISTNPSPSDQQQQQLAANVTVMSRSQAIRKLEELLSKKQALDCILYLHSMRYACMCVCACVCHVCCVCTKCVYMCVFVACTVCSISMYVFVFCVTK